MKYINAILFFTFLFVTSCSKPDPPYPDDIKFTKFILEQSLNPILEEDAIGVISGNEILLHLPKIAQDVALIASFEHNGERVTVNSVEQFSGKTENNFNQPLEYVVLADDNTKNKFTVVVNWYADSGPVLPHIYINLRDGMTIADMGKEEYLDIEIIIHGKGKYDNFQADAGIRGRGNTSWELPKKPFRIKLNQKASLFDLPSYKSWVLLADYLDGTLLYNSIPFKMGEMLEVPYTNHIIPVEVTVNGEYQGVYSFTEHKEVGEGRIDIGDNGVLLEMDVNFDEDWQFVSEKYYLPVMIQHPKSANIDEPLFEQIKQDFEAFEALLYDSSFPNNNYLDYFDDLSFVNYLLIYTLTLNREINHPKSVYINKPEGEKYRMGIIWDFDWGYGFTEQNPHYELSSAWGPLLYDGDLAGSQFFIRIMQDPHIRSLFKERWNWFKSNKYNELKSHIAFYSETIKPAVAQDHEKWCNRSASTNQDENLQKVLNWLDERTKYIDSYVSGF